MLGPSIPLAVAAVTTLLLGFQAWRLTSSKAIRLNTFIGTLALGYAAYWAGKPSGSQTAAIIAFFVAMIFGGRALGFVVRSRRDPDLRLPSTLLFTVAGTSLLAALAVLLWR